jgi:hypothetical protein
MSIDEYKEALKAVAVFPEFLAAIHTSLGADYLALFLVDSADAFMIESLVNFCTPA